MPCARVNCGRKATNPSFDLDLARRTACVAPRPTVYRNNPGIDTTL
jgi:hypothetical protein